MILSVVGSESVLGAGMNENDKGDPPQVTQVTRALIASAAEGEGLYVLMWVKNL